ncbi:hypothetical protein [Arsenophonus nasoniae]|uniref:hypothetical protein n=1 Tax=Arsenophonus nasoniae TaxID=638 RepID=UPI0038795E11
MNTLVKLYQCSPPVISVYGGSGGGVERLAGVHAGLQTLSGSPPNPIYSGGHFSFMTEKAFHQ